MAGQSLKEPRPFQDLRGFLKQIHFSLIESGLGVSLDSNETSIVAAR
jgi:hypothetical protein